MGVILRREAAKNLHQNQMQILREFALSEAEGLRTTSKREKTLQEPKRKRQP
jgi:hypothetical protein